MCKDQIFFKYICDFKFQICSHFHPLRLKKCTLTTKHNTGIKSRVLPVTTILDLDNFLINCNRKLFLVQTFPEGLTVVVKYKEIH